MRGQAGPAPDHLQRMGQPGPVRTGARAPPSPSSKTTRDEPRTEAQGNLWGKSPCLRNLPRSIGCWVTFGSLVLSLRHLLISVQGQCPPAISLESHPTGF